MEIPYLMMSGTTLTIKTTYLNSGEEVVNITELSNYNEYDGYGRIVKINYDYKYNGKIVTNTSEYETKNTRFRQVSETEYY